MFGQSQVNRQRTSDYDHKSSIGSHSGHQDLECFWDHNITALPSPPMSRPSTPSVPVIETSASVPVESESTTATVTAQSGSSHTTVASTSLPADYGVTSPVQTSQSIPRASTPSNIVLEQPVSLAAQQSGLTAIPAARPSRRVKTHVASACVNCKRAHLSCDIQRPCRRCVDSGRQSSCYDVQHKKRGRPRLREEVEAGPSRLPITISTQQATTMRPIAGTRTRRAESFRSHQSQGSESSSYGPMTPSYPFPPAGYYPPPSTPQRQETPIAYLNLDLVVLRANRAFEQAIRADRNITQSRLADLVAPIDGETFISIRNRLRGEREGREPSFLPPIIPAGSDLLDGVYDTDIDQLTQGFADNTYTWASRARGFENAPLSARVRLAKTTTYFVVVALSTMPGQSYFSPQAVTRSDLYQMTQQTTTTTAPLLYTYMPIVYSQQQYTPQAYIPVPMTPTSAQYRQPASIPGSWQPLPSDQNYQTSQPTTTPLYRDMPQGVSYMEPQQQPQAASLNIGPQQIATYAEAPTASQNTSFRRVEAESSAQATQDITSGDEAEDLRRRTSKRRRRMGIDDVLHR